MNIFTKARRAMSDDSGAVTVDWVVLTAAVVILSIGAITALGGGVNSLIGSISGELQSGASTVSGQTWTSSTASN